LDLCLFRVGFVVFGVFLFPMCSHHVPMRFSESPGCSPRRSQLCLRFIPYGLPKQIGDRQINVAHNVYLWRKVVCFVLFGLYLWDPRNQNKPFLHSWSLWKAVDEEGCMGLVSWHLDLQCRSSWILNDFFTEN
jgi:hypothetical protein